MWTQILKTVTNGIAGGLKGATNENQSDIFPNFGSIVGKVKNKFKKPLEEDTENSEENKTCEE